MNTKKNTKGISIIIPTYGSQNVLRDVLIGICNQKVCMVQVEIIIVYQKRNDIQEILESINKENISIHPIHSVKIGATRARNIGTIYARHSLLVYIDDDVIPDRRDWLQQIWNTYTNHHASVICGRVHPYPPLSSSLQKYNDLFVVFNHGNKLKYLPLGSFVPSAQLIIEKSLMMRVGGFRLNLDRVGTNLLSGCDNELSTVFGQIHQKVLYNPHIVAKHYILPFKRRRSYLIRRVFWQGVTDSYVENHFQRVGIQMILRYAYVMGKLLFNRLIFPIGNKDQVTYLHSFSFTIGYICGLIYSFFTSKPNNRPLQIYEQV